METVEAAGDSIDAAIAAAAATLGVGRDRITVEILNDASRGFLGLGARQARVRARLRPPLEATTVDESGGVPAADATATPFPRIDLEAVDHARTVLQTIVDHIGVTARVSASEDGDHISLDIDGDASGLLIGRKGQMLDALEYLVARIVARDEQRPVHVVVDSHGYRERRRQSLEEMALRMAQEARRRNRSVTLEEMSPRDRRTIHLALQHESDLTTHSSGDGHYRKVVIVPNGSGHGPRTARPARD
jgi:spoIIIJ-associated protein